MLIEKTAPNILQAMTAMQTDLPALVGSEWMTVEATITAQTEALRTADETGRAERVLLRTLREFPPAYERLDIELKRQALLSSTMQAELSALANQLQLPPSTVQAAIDAGLMVIEEVDEADRILIVPVPENGNLRRATQINFFKLSGLMAGGMMLMAEPQTALLTIAGVLGFIANVEGTLPRRLSLEDSSVFLGIYRAHKDEMAYEQEIISRTNAERIACNLPPLTAEQINQSLHSLADMAIIKSISDGQWRIIENFQPVG